jgi:hypothetical protein
MLPQSLQKAAQITSKERGCTDTARIRVIRFLLYNSVKHEAYDVPYAWNLIGDTTVHVDKPSPGKPHEGDFPPCGFWTHVIAI